MVLLAILRLGKGAYGATICRELETRTGRQVSRGALYATLDRLERKNLVEWEIEAATSRSQGNRRRRFQVTEAGVAEAAAAKAAFVNLWQGLDSILLRPGAE